MAATTHINQEPRRLPMTDIHSDKILILDFGAQYTQLIARRIRELGVYCEIWAWDHDPAEIAAFAPRGIILSGGPESTTEAGSPRALLDDTVLDPWRRTHHSAEELAALEESLPRLRGLVVQSVMISFQGAVNRVIGRSLRRST